MYRYRTVQVVAVAILVTVGSGAWSSVAGGIDGASVPPRHAAGVARQANCDPNYGANGAGQCVPVSPEGVNCSSIPGNDFPVVGSDVYGLDAGGVPGLACESGAGEAAAPTDASGAVNTTEPPPEVAGLAQEPGAEPTLPTTGRWSWPMAIAAAGMLFVGGFFLNTSAHLRERLRGGFTVVTVRPNGGTVRTRVTRGDRRR
jgi:hypothetical protein